MTTPEAALAAAVGPLWISSEHDGTDDTCLAYAAKALAALHDAGWVLTPLAPEVPPLDVDRLVDIAEMAAGEVMTGNDFGRYHKAIRGHFRDRLVRADEHRPFMLPAWASRTPSGDAAAPFDEAWAEAEAALPEQHGGLMMRTEGDWGEVTGYVAWTFAARQPTILGRGSTPVEALRELASALRAAAPAEAREKGPTDA